MTQPSRKTLLDLLRRWMNESYPYPSQELLDATREALGAVAVKPEMEGQTSLDDFQAVRPHSWRAASNEPREIRCGDCGLVSEPSLLLHDDKRGCDG